MVMASEVDRWIELICDACGKHLGWAKQQGLYLYFGLIMCECCHRLSEEAERVLSK